MRLKPQNSPKQVLEAEIEQLRAERSLLSDDINRLVKERNVLIDEVKAEGERQMASLRVVEESCAGQKSTLLAEVTSLEARRAEAIKPLSERSKALDEREASITRNQATLVEMARRTGEERVLVAEKLAEVADMRSEASEKLSLAEHRLEMVAKAEEINRKATVDIGEQWISLRAAQAEQEKMLKDRKEALSVREGVVEKDRLWLRDERDRQAAEKRQMQSERVALTAAFEEGRKKKYL